MVPSTGPWVSPCSILGPNTHAEPLRLLTRYSVAARPMVQPVLTYKRAQSLGIHAWSIALPFLHARSREDPEWDCFWGARPSHRQGLAPVLKVWLGKRGRQLPPARGERRSEGGWGEDITGMLCSPASTTPLQTHGEAQSRQNQPQNQHERFPVKGRAPALSTSHPRPPIHTLYIYTCARPRALCAHSPTRTDTQNTTSRLRGAAPWGGEGEPGARLQPRSIGVFPPPPRLHPGPTVPPNPAPVPRYRQRTIRAGSGRCGAGRSGPPPPGRPPPCAASVWRGGGERAEKPREGPKNYKE